LGGGALRTGDLLQIAQARVLPEATLRCPVWARPRQVVRAVLGPQEQHFPQRAIAALFAEPFAVTDAGDRMGVRLRGPDRSPDAALRLPSGAILRGSVQVAGDGVATVLLADHQTTGGYPRIATIISTDIDGFAQLRPRDTVRFQQVSPAQAVAIVRQQRGLYPHGG
jgi:allophanate hydrolase